VVVRSFFKVFLLQGLLMWVISAPLLGAQVSPTPDGLTLLDLAAILVWGVGFLFEALGDCKWRASKPIRPTKAK